MCTSTTHQFQFSNVVISPVFKCCTVLKSHAGACSRLFLVCLFDSQGWNSFYPCIWSPIRIVLTALILLFQGQDEHLLESPTCIRFLIKYLFNY